MKRKREGLLTSAITRNGVRPRSSIGPLTSTGALKRGILHLEVSTNREDNGSRNPIRKAAPAGDRSPDRPLSWPPCSPFRGSRFTNIIHNVDWGEEFFPDTV